MNINIKATNMELTSAINIYVDKRLASLQKFFGDAEMSGQVEVGKTTNHHKQGDVFKAEIDINVSGKNYFSNSEKDDLYAAIDDAREQIMAIATREKDRKQTLYKRGASSVKKMLKGISKRNPFTSKY